MKLPPTCAFCVRPWRAISVKQPHTEQSIDHTEDQQNTGNHKVPGAPDAAGADKFGGTRVGSKNVEGEEKEPSNSEKTPPPASR